MLKQPEFINLIKDIGSYKSNDEAKNALNAVVSAIQTAVTANDGVNISNLGSFKTAIQKGRTGKVPGTTKTYTTSDKSIVKFKAGKLLPDMVAAK